MSAGDAIASLVRAVEGELFEAHESFHGIFDSSQFAPDDIRAALFARAHEVHEVCKIISVIKDALSGDPTGKDAAKLATALNSLANLPRPIEPLGLASWCVDPEGFARWIKGPDGYAAMNADLYEGDPPPADFLKWCVNPADWNKEDWSGMPLEQNRDAQVFASEVRLFDAVQSVLALFPSVEHAQNGGRVDCTLFTEHPAFFEKKVQDLLKTRTALALCAFNAVAESITGNGAGDLSPIIKADPHFVASLIATVSDACSKPGQWFAVREACRVIALKPVARVKSSMDARRVGYEHLIEMIEAKHPAKGRGWKMTAKTLESEMGKIRAENREIVLFWKKAGRPPSKV
jgi:hypothetical protein